MEFDEVIVDLYSNDFEKVYQILCKSVHRENVSFNIADEGILGIHTGVYFEIRHDVPMELIYCALTKELVCQKCNHSLKSPQICFPKIGEIMRWCFTQNNGDDYGRFVPYESKGYGEYNAVWYYNGYDSVLKAFIEPPKRYSISRRENLHFSEFRGLSCNACQKILGRINFPFNNRVYTE